MDTIPPGMPQLIRRKSLIEESIIANEEQATQLAKDSKKNDIESKQFQYDMQLNGCVFVGHTNTDLDSIAAAIGAAHLFGGIAARASDINTETEWVLKKWGFTVPKPFLDIKDVQDKDVCLVDFNQRSQLTKGVDEKKIKGIIDHHALRDGAVATDFPIYIDVRPWGSVATILSHTYLRNRVPLPKNVAGLLLSAILSDTLNMNSPTCTPTDKLMVATLAKIAAVEDVDSLAREQFKAKSRMFFRYTIPEILRGDLKRFSIRDLCLAFGVCETADTETVLSKREEIIAEMKAMKAEDQDTYVFFAVIDVAKLTSTLLIPGLPEKELAEKAFEVKMDEKTWTMNLGNRVSRKKTMVPPLDKLLKSGFQLSAAGVAAQKKALSKEAQEAAGKLKLVYDKNCVGEIRRILPTLKKAAVAVKAMNAFKKLGKFGRKK